MEKPLAINLSGRICLTRAFVRHCIGLREFLTKYWGYVWVAIGFSCFKERKNLKYKEEIQDKWEGGTPQSRTPGHLTLNISQIVE